MSETRDIDAQHLHDQAAAATQRSEELSQRSNELADQIADTELDVARVHDTIAENDATSLRDQAREVAAGARRFADQERCQATKADPDR